MNSDTPQQNSLFPTRDSLQEVVDEALGKLPITSQNELIALLQLQQNTILQLLINSPKSLKQR